MSKVAEIQARINADQIALKEALAMERDEAVQRVRNDIQLFGMNSIDLKGLIKTRLTVKQATEFLARKAEEETKVKRPRAAKKTEK